MGEPGTSGVLLRRAGDADAPAIGALVAAAYGKYVERIGRLPLPMTTDQAAAIRDHVVWVAVDTTTDELIGVLELTEAEDHIFIVNVAVAPARQGIGLGRRLLDHGEAEARLAGREEVRLETNERFAENLAMYARRGYREVGRHPNQGTDVVELAKRLT